MLRRRCKTDTWHLCAFIREHGGFQNFHVQRLVSKECTSSLEARAELRKHFDASAPTLNKRLPTRTQQHYAKTEEPKARQKVYRDVNKDNIKQDQQNIYNRNKEKIAISRKVYYEVHGERMRERMQAHRRKLKQSGLEGQATPTATTQAGGEALAATTTTNPIPNLS